MFMSFKTALPANKKLVIIRCDGYDFRCGRCEASVNGVFDTVQPYEGDNFRTVARCLSCGQAYAMNKFFQWEYFVINPNWISFSLNQLRIFIQENIKDDAPGVAAIVFSIPIPDIVAFILKDFYNSSRDLIFRPFLTGAVQFHGGDLLVRPVVELLKKNNLASQQEIIFSTVNLARLQRQVRDKTWWKFYNPGIKQKR